MEDMWTLQTCKRLYMHWHCYRTNLLGAAPADFRDSLASRPYGPVSTNHRFVGAIGQPPLQIGFLGAAGYRATPTSPFFRNHQSGPKK